jgi:hypothetical protein
MTTWSREPGLDGDGFGRELQAIARFFEWC